uniref:Uncharacterized protein n=1 Tax=Parascaris equorum TaxID=6256 RepID=A0A914S5J5_PAREQ
MFFEITSSLLLYCCLKFEFQCFNSYLQIKSGIKLFSYIKLDNVKLSVSDVTSDLNESVDFVGIIISEMSDGITDGVVPGVNSSASSIS